MNIARFLSLFWIASGLLGQPFSLDASPSKLTEKDTLLKAQEIMQGHVKYKKLSPMLMQRVLKNFIQDLDPTKTYFTEPEISSWLQAPTPLLEEIQQEYQEGNFRSFVDIYQRMEQAIVRRNTLEEEIRHETLPQDVDTAEFKELDWSKDHISLKERLRKIKALQREVAEMLEEEQKEKLEQRIAKRRMHYEEDISPRDPEEKQREMLTRILKATASALDGQTTYFTPSEASQFMISMQQRLFGIGVRLRDDLTGLTIIEIIEGGPSSKTKTLQPKDRIIAVNGEPTIGMDIFEAVELIRGEEGSPVTLTIVRESMLDGEKAEEKFDTTIVRGEVVLGEARMESQVEPFGPDAIAIIRLHTFYQDPQDSSSSDIAKTLRRIQQEHHLAGVILDLRNNLGGLVTQAVNVTGLFINKGIVMSIKDNYGKLQHLRDIDGKKIWDGPLVILTNRLSASASEIVAQTLQDYGRALVVGDRKTFGKGTYQLVTIDSQQNGKVNPKGEYKVTKGLYYTVSGKSPQLAGVQPDIEVPSPLSELEIGEEHSKYPLENERIAEHFHDDLSDIPFFQRQQVAKAYRQNLQQRLSEYTKLLPTLKKNSEARLTENTAFKNFLEEMRKEEDIDRQRLEIYRETDFQLNEAIHIMKDIIWMRNQEQTSSKKAA